jgi:hypothetical protein
VSAGVFFTTDVEALIWGDGLSGGLIPFGVGGVTASILWSVSLWFASPLQLLLLFLGKIETERPSDWFMNVLAGSLGLPTKDLAYEHPAYIRVAAVVFIVASGVAIAAALDKGLGSATWGVSSGIATCLAAGVYELGRPERLSADKAVELEGLYQTFGVLLCSGSEILSPCSVFFALLLPHKSIAFLLSRGEVYVAVLSQSACHSFEKIHTVNYG